MLTVAVKPRVVWGTLLKGLLDLTSSEYGFIGEVKYEPDGTMYLQTYAITNIAWDAATRAFYEDNVDSGLKFTNLNTLFGRVMTTKSTVLSNDPKSQTPGRGIPKGHPPLNAFLGIPFFKQAGSDMVGMVGIANKPGGYEQADVEYLEPFTTTCSNLLRAYNAIRENQELISSLEDKVKERTLELEHTNEDLARANSQIVEASAAQLEHFACMSHEIRTPLNCVIGMSSLMIQDGEFDPRQRESMEMIVNSGELLLRIVNDVLDYSKLESGKMEIEPANAELQSTFNSVLGSIQVNAAGSGLTLETTYGYSVPSVARVDR